MGKEQALSPRACRRSLHGQSGAHGAVYRRIPHRRRRGCCSRIISTVMGFGRNGDRDSLLRALADIEGVYVPQVHNGSLPVGRRIVTDLDGAFYPVRPVVPYTSIVHDRIAIEVSRGCTKGCRFCQAGMVYRPRRDQKPRPGALDRRGGPEEYGLRGGLPHLSQHRRLSISPAACS
ncbi:MAG: hypothetical protein MZV70_01180 [Desulfobacterales bacterium]|nr:hypothetical protein [Desulfobacterales bacterium]